MGTWGAGNLDNDYALDELGERTNTLVQSILTRARKKTSREADEYDYTTLFVEFEILFALEGKGLLHGTFPVEEEVLALKREYLADWSTYIDELKPRGDFKARRRKVIQSTFNRFARICRKHNEG